MSAAYEAYLITHKSGVKQAWDWIQENIPWVLKDLDKDLDWEMQFGHDESKHSKEEYQAYDDYFYGGNKSYAVVQNFKYAWLHHIHNNPHHWQHWALINDEPDEGTVALEMPFEYVIEMICDWWSFSFNKGDLREIFNWYDEHKANMVMHDKTRKQVEYILGEIKKKLDELTEDIHAEIVIEEGDVEHHGIKGQKWGKRNGPPYPLDAVTNAKVRMNAKHFYDDKYGKVSEKDLSKHPIEDLDDVRKFDISDENAKKELRARANADDAGTDSSKHNVGRHFNCPNCAMAFEMIERGYAVKARMKKDRSNVGDIDSFFENGKLERASEDIPYTEHPKTSVPLDKISSFDKLSKKDNAAIQEYFNKETANCDKAVKVITDKLLKGGEGARGIVVTSWYQWDHGRDRKNTAFHAFNYKIENGQVFYYDVQGKKGQNGDTNTSWIYDSDYNDIYTMRTDNLKLSKNATSAVYSVDEKEWKGK